MASIECNHCGQPVYSAAKTCPHCDMPLSAAARKFSEQPEETPFTILRESGLFAATGAGAAIIGGSVAFLELTYGAILIGIGLVVFLVGRIH